MPLLLSVCFFTGYLIESTFGFGGAIIALGLLAYFIDIKDILYLVLYGASCASLFVLLSDYKKLNLKELYRVYIFALPGILIGSYLMTVLSSGLLLNIFSIFLIAFSIKNLIGKEFNFPPIISKSFLFSGGVIQGIYGTGAPFILMGTRNTLTDKSEIRSTIAMFLLSTNIIRLIQFYIMGDLEIRQISDHWWIAFPIAIAVAIGYFLHKKISDKFFKKGIMVLLLIVGIAYLIK